MALTFVVLAHIFMCFECMASDSLNPPLTEQLKVEFLTEINNLRVQNQHCGSAGRFRATAPLVWNDQLANAAYEHALDMYQNNFFDHTGSDGSRPSARVTAAGYTWSHVGENISAGLYSPKQVIAAWMKSSGHCRTIMDSRFTEVGAARVGTYWVLTVASPR